MYSNTEIILIAIAESMASGRTKWKAIQTHLKTKYFIEREINSLSSIYQRNKEYITIEIERIRKEKPIVVDKPKELREVKVELLSNGTTASERKLILSEEQLKSKVFLLNAHGFDSNEFELVSATNNFWDSQTSEGTVLTLYQSKIVARPKIESEELTRNDISKILDQLQTTRFNKTFKLIDLSDREDGYALEVDWADLHCGSLSWHEEVGEDNDYKIAFGNVKKVLNQLIHIIKTRKIKKIIHCFLGDFLHVDTGGLTTSGGTQVDFDSRPLKMIKKGYELVMYIIDTTSIIPMEVKWVSGNHSKLVEFAVFYALPMIYKDNPEIQFDVDPVTRKVLSHGEVLIGLAHGNDIGKKEMFTWLQHEFREQWAKAKYVEIHLGHLHQEYVMSEMGGITVRVNPALKVIDKYEHDHAWVSKKMVLAYLYHETEHLKEVFYLK